MSTHLIRFQSFFRCSALFSIGKISHQQHKRQMLLRFRFYAFKSVLGCAGRSIVVLCAHIVVKDDMLSSTWKSIQDSLLLTS